jgi:hypothetical protein
MAAAALGEPPHSAAGGGVVVTMKLRSEFSPRAAKTQAALYGGAVKPPPAHLAGGALPAERPIDYARKLLLSVRRREMSGRDAVAFLTTHLANKNLI